MSRETINKLFALYQNAINEFDDYFEYQCESKKDRTRVFEILDKLSESIDEAVRENNEKN